MLDVWCLVVAVAQMVQAAGPGLGDFFNGLLGKVCTTVASGRSARCTERSDHELLEGASTAQRSDPYAQQVVQTFPRRQSVSLGNLRTTAHQGHHDGVGEWAQAFGDGSAGLSAAQPASGATSAHSAPPRPVA